jgi:hypothetical protein
MKYLLSIFIEHNEQELFVKSIGKEISTISSKNGVKYFFGPQTALFTFETKLSFEGVKNFFDSILSDLSITHILVPIKTDKMSYWFEKEHEKLLFGTDICATNEEYSEEEQEEMREAILGDLTKIFEKEIIEENRVKQKIVPTLDDLLDKINMSGLNSLNEEEKDLLKQYSK